MRSPAPLIGLLVLIGCSAAPQSLTVVADRSSAVANGTDAVLITATAQGVVDFTVSDGGQLSASRVSSDSAGVATTKLTATTPGPVTVTASGAMGATGSTTVTFTSASAPHLRFQTSPSNTVAQNLLRPIPTVVVEDGAGVVTSSSASVSVAVTPGSCSASLDATSLMTVTASQGVASFYGLKISTAATGCTLTATSGSLPSAVSTAFDIQ